MSIRMQFDAAIDAEAGPPSRVDVDGIVRGGRVRRRLAAAGAGAAVAAALTVVAVLVGTAPPERAGIPDPPTSRKPPARTATAAPSVEMSPIPGYGTTATPGVPAETWNAVQAARLSAAFERRLRAVAPAGTTYLDTPVNGKVTGPFEFNISPGPDNRYSGYFSVGPDLQDGQGVSSVVISVGKPIGTVDINGLPLRAGSGIGQFQECPGEATDKADCEIRLGPHDEKIVAMPRFQVDGGKKIARIDVTTADGTGITIEVRNFSVFRSGSRAELPITLDQMIQLAMDPDLVISTT